MERLEKIKQFKESDLYPVTCQQLSNGRRSLAILKDLLSAGVTVIQLREKTIAMAQLYELALLFREETQKAHALLIINDHVDLALAVGADGVHLGQKDLPLEAARQIAPHLIIGQSCHGLDQACIAQNKGADYVNLGPIYPTNTKAHLSEFLGPQKIQEIAPYLHIPFTVMGGINLSNIDEVISAGARHVAVVTAVTQAQDVTKAALELRQHIISQRTRDN